MGNVVSPRLLGFVLPHFSSHATLHLIALHDSAIAKRWETKTTQEEDEELEGDEEHEEDQQFEEDILTMQDGRSFDSLLTRFCSWYSSSPSSILSLWYPWSGRISALPMLGGHSARMREEWILRNSVSSEARDRMLDAELHNLGTLSRSPTPVSECNTILTEDS